MIYKSDKPAIKGPFDLESPWTCSTQHVVGLRSRVVVGSLSGSNQRTGVAIVEPEEILSSADRPISALTLEGNKWVCIHKDEQTAIEIFVVNGPVEFSESPEDPPEEKLYLPEGAPIRLTGEVFVRADREDTVIHFRHD
tara:strand:- start:10116 stop:10532 length:417 start_codon:yes stop_codon:yes gene_type:complete